MFLGARDFSSWKEPRGSFRPQIPLLSAICHPQPPSLYPPPTSPDSASSCRYLTPNNPDLPWPLVPFPWGADHVWLKSLLRLVIDMEQDNQRDRGLSPVQLSSPGPPALPPPSRPAAGPGALFPGPAWSHPPQRGWDSGLRPRERRLEPPFPRHRHRQGPRSSRHPLLLPVPPPPSPQPSLGWTIP